MHLAFNCHVKHLISPITCQLPISAITKVTWVGKSIWPRYTSVDHFTSICLLQCNVNKMFQSGFLYYRPKIIRSKAEHYFRFPNWAENPPWFGKCYPLVWANHITNFLTLKFHKQLTLHKNGLVFRAWVPSQWQICHCSTQGQHLHPQKNQ